MEFNMESIDLDALTTQAIAVATSWGGKIIMVILILMIGRWLAGKFERLTAAAMSRAKLDVTLQTFAGSMVRYGVLAFTVIAALEKVGVEATSFVAVLGAAGFAIGLAFQGTLGNFSSGVMLLFFRPYNVGDYVEGGGHSGVVKQLGLFTTTMITGDNVTIIVPNGEIAGGTIKNHGVIFPGGHAGPDLQKFRRVDYTVGVSYDADIDQAKAVIMDVLAKIPTILDTPAPSAPLVDLGASSIDFNCRAWCKTEDYWATREAILHDCKEALDAAGIGIPYPQMDVHFPGGAPSN